RHAVGSGVMTLELCRNGLVYNCNASRSSMPSAGCYYAMTPRSWYYAKLTAFSAFPFVPLLVPVGYYAGVPWLAPAFAFIGIPVLDLLIGADRTRPLESPVPRPAIAWLRTIPRLYVFVWLGTLIWAAHAWTSESAPLTATW